MNPAIHYHPLVSRPFRRSGAYREIPPSPALAPYIRCFWGGVNPQQAEDDRGGNLVIPDTCVDLLYHINEADGTVQGGFAGINDHSTHAHFVGNGRDVYTTFAIRFYAWSACRFAEDTLSGTLNGYLDAGDRFPALDRQLRQALPRLSTLEERSTFAERLLLTRLAESPAQPLVEEAVQRMLASRGTMDIARLAREVFISTRQLERAFHAAVGITPKRLSGLIRYQLVWQDALRPGPPDLPALVVRYGFTDEAHLMHEFRRYHQLDLRTARRQALEDVGNLQDS